MKSQGGRTKRRTNNVCTVQLAPSFCSFLALQVLEFHTRRAAGSMGLPPRPVLLSLSRPLSFLADSFTLVAARSFTRSRVQPSPLSSVSYFPRPKNPLLLFYLARPVFVSLCLSLSLALFLCARLIICAFWRSCSLSRPIVFARASFEPDSLARARGPPGERETVRVECESGQTARRERRKKKRYNKRG